jgi:copper resistance protein D
VDELTVASRFVQFAAVSLLVGAPLFRLVIQPAGPIKLDRPPVELAAAIAALLSGLGWLAGVAASMAGGWFEAVDPDTFAAVMLDTRFGHLWIARLALIVAIIVLCARTKCSRTPDVALLVLSAAATASLVGVGHGLEGSGSLALIHPAADVVHLLCMAIWLGGLFYLALVLRRAVTVRDVDPDVVRTVLPRFSRIGYGAVGLLLVSGFINAIILVPRPEALINTLYGRILLVKISLAALMVIVAIVNRIVLTPRVLDQPAAITALWRNILVEQATGLLVLAAVALLGTIHPGP